MEDARIEQLVRDAAREMFKGVDLSSALGGVLDTPDPRWPPRPAAEQALDRALRVMDNAETRGRDGGPGDRVADQEHPRKQKLLPAMDRAERGRRHRRRGGRAPEEHSRQSGARAPAAVRRVGARLRAAAAVGAAVARARRDIKQYLLDDAAFGSYVGGLWGSLKAWLQEDLRNPQSAFHPGRGLGRPLAG